MSLFKEKSHHKNGNTADQRITIDAMHNIQLNKFEDSRDKVGEFTSQLNQYEKRLSELDEISKSDLTDDQLEEHFELKESIQELKQKISEINNNQAENKYLLDSINK